MILDAIQSVAHLLSKSSQLPSGQSDREAFYQLQLTPGQQVQAELMASLPNQRYLARIAGKLFNIELPIIVQPGETLQLTYVTGEPNPTFSLSKAGNSQTPVTISDAGKLLNRIVMDGADPGRMAALSRNGPVLGGAPTDASVFARLLGEAFSLEGIFYESHLLQWFCGDRSIRDILKEPQGKLSRRIKSPDGRNDAGKTEAMDGDELPLGAFVEEPDAEKKEGLQVDPRIIPIVHEQLRALHSGQVFWRGEVWPRQNMEWSVLEEKNQGGEGRGKSWLSTLRLDLPNLGKVDANLRLGKDGVSILIDAVREDSASLMRQESPGLEQEMADSGIKLLELKVNHEVHGE